MLDLKQKAAFRFIMLFGLMFVGMIVSGSFSILFESIFQGRDFLLAGSVVQNVIAFFLPAYYTYKYSGCDTRVSLGLYGRYDWKAFAVALIIFVVSFPAMEFVIEWNEKLRLPQSMSDIQASILEMESKAREMTDMILSVDSIGGLIVNIVIVGGLTGFCEEIFFRGGVQGLLKKSGINSHACVWIAALVFSVMHFQFLGFFPRLLVGAFCGYLYKWTKSIWLSATLHAINNSVVVVVYWLNMRNIGFETEDLYSVAGSWFPLLASVSTVCTFLVILYLRKYIIDNHGVKKC